MQSLTDIIHYLLQNPARPEINGFDDWKKHFKQITQQHPATWQSALVGGFYSNCVGYAFASGYQSALHQLIPDCSSLGLGALCVTEEGGNHPRAIKTRLNGENKLNGSKSFITGGTQADYLLIAASTGTQADGKPQLKLLHIPCNTEGVTINAMPSLKFVPEIEHATVTFQDVTIDQSQILSGDGYAEYIKPFRTIEDIHVSLSLAGYLLNSTLGSESLKQKTAVKESLLTMIASHVQLCQLDPKHPATHLLVAGARQQLEALLPSLEDTWKTHNDAIFSTWQRDKKLLGVAKTARDKRTEAAWKHYDPHH